MEDPKTRRESKKTPKEKNGEKYGQKHVRAVAALKKTSHTVHLPIRVQS
jgi:hypothetical protein